jgi:alkylation response protein AidB-like acyl-CoA dehydrogenase
VKHNWYFGDAVNPRDPDLILTPDGESFRLNGIKNFSTGAKSSDVIVIAGNDQSYRLCGDRIV